jgi:hypothetical protein
MLHFEPNVPKGVSITFQFNCFNRNNSPITETKYLSTVTKCYMIVTCMSDYRWGLDW